MVKYSTCMKSYSRIEQFVSICTLDLSCTVVCVHNMNLIHGFMIGMHISVDVQTVNFLTRLRHAFFVLLLSCMITWEYWNCFNLCELVHVSHTCILCTASFKHGHIGILRTACTILNRSFLGFSKHRTVHAFFVHSTCLYMM